MSDFGNSFDRSIVDNKVVKLNTSIKSELTNFAEETLSKLVIIHQSELIYLYKKLLFTDMNPFSINQGYNGSSMNRFCKIHENSKLSLYCEECS